MSEDNSPQQEQPVVKSRGTVKFAAMAGVLGIVAGAGLYAFLGQNGNDEFASAGQGSCAINEAMQASLDGAASGDVAAFKALDRPFSVAAFEFNDFDGKKKSLADWQGKTVLFNLWATWCAPCRAEMPALDALQKDLGGEEFEVVPVSVDLGSDAKPKKFYDDIGMKSAGFFHDGEMNSLNVLKKNGLAFGLPATLLVGGDGCVLGTLNGPAEWHGDDAVNLIKTAL